ncbi:MAG: class I SAM-dependent methyltransferase [Elainellaceae cyanobacterium]
MAVRKDTIFERFLSPIFSTFLIDREALQKYRQSKDWEQEADRFRQANLVYPDYYRLQNFHGIEGGYLTPSAAVTYDPITQYLLPPGEEWVRKGLIERIRCQPRRILDLGCGTGSTTLLLKQAFPDAEVIGMDISPYMLVVADEKAQKAGLDIQFRHGNAEQTGFTDSSFDLVTASLLFHETPPQVSLNILRECFRLLMPGGEVLILDGNQSGLRWADWLTNLFEEPYIKEYAAGSVDAWMGAAGFGDVRTEEVWLINQVTRGVKPLPYQKIEFQQQEPVGDRQWVTG